MTTCNDIQKDQKISLKCGAVAEITDHNENSVVGPIDLFNHYSLLSLMLIRLLSIRLQLISSDKDSELALNDRSDVINRFIINVEVY